jgi:hypothetical protein
LINFTIGNTGFNIQFIPIYGLSIGVLYYNPNLEPEEKDYKEEFYEQLTLMFLFFGIHITWWKL